MVTHFLRDYINIETHPALGRYLNITYSRQTNGCEVHVCKKKLCISAMLLVLTGNSLKVEMARGG